MNNQEVKHEIRNALIGCFLERKNILKSMCIMAECSTGNLLVRFIKVIVVIEPIREVLSSIRKLDRHLERIQEAIKKLDG